MRYGMVLGLVWCTSAMAAEPGLRVGWAQADITPALTAGPVYIAGFGQNRQATGVHDRLFVRAAVLSDGTRQIGLTSVDLIGLFLPVIERIRAQVPEFAFVIVSSTHNHEGPDTLGLWGPSPFATGVNAAYLDQVVTQTVTALRAAAKSAQPVTARWGTARNPDLLNDNRKPTLKHDELVALQFQMGTKTAGVIVQWNCHPETLNNKNTLLSADFVGYTVAALEKHYECPVLYLTGTVGGLLTSLDVPINDAQGRPLQDGTFEKTERYGQAVAELAKQALQAATPITLTPLGGLTQAVFLPVDNKLYQAAWHIGVLNRPIYEWAGAATTARPITLATARERKCPLAVRTELTWLRLGELDVAGVPGEIYSELVLGGVPDPAEAGADFPTAPIEPTLYAAWKDRKKMLIGLANDEIGYIIPKRQWDAVKPYAYGRTSAPYGEINSLGPDTAPLLLTAWRELLSGVKAGRNEK
jgi:hypothetical protein